MNLFDRLLWAWWILFNRRRKHKLLLFRCEANGDNANYNFYGTPYRLQKISEFLWNLAEKKQIQSDPAVVAANKLMEEE